MGRVLILVFCFVGVALSDGLADSVALGQKGLVSRRRIDTKATVGR